MQYFLSPAQIIESLDDIIRTLERDEDRFYLVIELLSQARDEISADVDE